MQDQKTHFQTDALKNTGYGKIFHGKASCVQRDRPDLKAALDYIRARDTLLERKRGEKGDASLLGVSAFQEKGDASLLGVSAFQEGKG